MKSGIYKITDLRNNKMYIGQAVDLKRRKWRHWCFLHPERYKKSSLSSEINMLIHQAMMESQKEEDFIFEVIEYCSKEKLGEKEWYYINVFNTFSPNGYNSFSQIKTENRPKGETHYKHKITEDESNQIVKMLKEGASVRDIQRIVPSATIGIISTINSGRCWRKANEVYPLSRLNGVKTFSDEEIREIRQLKEEGVSVTELSKRFNTSTGHISSITLGKIRKDAGGPIAVLKKLSDEEVIMLRKEYSKSTLTKKDLWKKSAYKEKLSYDAFCDMINGVTYSNLPIFTRPNEKYTNALQEKKERYQKIKELYAKNIYTKREIAKQVGCSERTVYRALEEKDDN